MLLFTKDISFPLLSFVSFIYYPGPRHLPYTQLGDSLSFIFYFILSPSPYIIQDPGTLHTTQALTLHSIRTPSPLLFSRFFLFLLSKHLLLFTQDISFPLLSFVSFSIYYPGPRHLTHNPGTPFPQSCPRPNHPKVISCIFSYLLQSWWSRSSVPLSEDGWWRRWRRSSGNWGCPGSTRSKGHGGILPLL